MTALRRIVERFLPITTIHVDGDEIVFQTATTQARAQPLIRVAEDGKIIEIGKPATTAESGRLIRLFEPDGVADDQAIRAFCRYQLARTSNANPLRPRVRIIEPTFRKAFGREAASVLQRVLRADGFQSEIVERVN